MSLPTANRIPPGVPTGGRFAPGGTGGPGVELQYGPDTTESTTGRRSEHALGDRHHLDPIRPVRPNDVRVGDGVWARHLGGFRVVASVSGIGPAGPPTFIAFDDGGVLRCGRDEWVDVLAVE